MFRKLDAITVLTARLLPAPRYRVYRDNAEHREIIGKFIQPIAGQRAAVQYEF